MKMIVDVPKEIYKEIKSTEFLDPECAGQTIGGAAINAIANGTKITSSCDLCRFNPPSSRDGKPCTMCVAETIELD